MILNCAILEVNLETNNYENSEVVKIDIEVSLGYNSGTLRGLIDESGLILEIVIGAIKTHDFKLTKDMVLESKILKPVDVLINERGFSSKNQINILKKLGN